MGLDKLDSAITTQGRLSEHPAIELLGLLLAGRRTGRMAIRQGRLEVNIYVSCGIPVSAETTSPGNTMIDAMARDGVITQEEARNAEALAAQQGLTIEQYLESIKGLDSERIYYYRVKAAKEIIVKAGGYQEGDYRFEDSAEVMAGVPMYDLNPLEILYEAMTRYHIHDLATDIYAIEDRKISLNPTVTDYFLLPGPLYDHSHALDIFLSEVPVGQAMAMLQDEFQDLNQAVLLLYLLIITGQLQFSPQIEREDVIEDLPERNLEELDDEIVELPSPETEEICLDEGEGTMDCDTFVPQNEFKDFTPGAITAPPAPPPATAQPESPAPVTPAQATHPSPESAPEEFRREAIKPPAPPPKPRPAPPTPPLSAEQRNRLLRELLRLQKRLDEAKSPFEMMQVSLDDGATELNQAYAKKKKILSPDGAAWPADLAALASTISRKLDDAHQTLVNPDLRIRYERTLFEEETKRTWNLELRKSLAKKMGARGHWYLRQNAPLHALECFKHAVDLDPGSGEYYMDLGWSLYRAHPEKAPEARGYLRSALQANPRLDMAPYYLGIIAKREGNASEAESFFRQALQLNPKNPSAQRELSFHAQNLKQKGIWNKLFKT